MTTEHHVHDDPLRCEDCTVALIDHAFGELPNAQATQTARHLAECSTCALEYCRLRADLDGITSAVAQAPRPEVRVRLRARVHGHFAPPWWRTALASLRRPIPAYGAIAAAALPMALWGLARTLNPAGVEAARTPAAHPAVIELYDASTVLRVDPSIL